VNDTGKRAATGTFFFSHPVSLYQQSVTKSSNNNNNRFFVCLSFLLLGSSSSPFNSNVYLVFMRIKINMYVFAWSIHASGFAQV
jgi:hypothetical protein